MTPSPASSGGESRPDTEAIRRGLKRANAVALVIVMALLGLATAAIYQTRLVNRARLEVEERSAVERVKLFQSYLQQARFERYSDRADARRDGLAAVGEASLIQVTPELRTEAIGLLQLPALQFTGSVQLLPDNASLPIFDAALERFVMGDGGDSVSVFRYRDYARLHHFTGLPRPINWMRFSPDGRLLAGRLLNGELRVFDLENNSALWNRPGVFYIGVDGALDFSPDSRQLACVVRRGEVSILDASTAEELRALACSATVNGMRFDPSGKRLAVAAGEALLIYDVDDGRLVREISLRSVSLNKLHWHPEGQLVAGAGSDSFVYLLDPGTGAVQRLSGHTKPVIHVAFNQQGDWLLSDAFDGTSRIWDVQRRETLLTTSVALGNYFSPAGDELGFVRIRHSIGKWQIVRGLGPALLPGPVEPSSEVALEGQAPFHARHEASGIAVTWFPDADMTIQALADGTELATMSRPPGASLTGIHFDEAGDLIGESNDGKRLQWPLAAVTRELGAAGLGWGVGASQGVAVVPARLGTGGAVAGATIVALVFACGLSLLAWRWHRRLLLALVEAENTVGEQHARLSHAQDSVAQSRKMQAVGTLAAGIAHDFNNLLSVIRMAGKIMGRERCGDPVVQENVASIERAVVQGRSVVGALLGYSRENPEETGGYSVVSAVEDTVAMISRRYLESVTLTLELDTGAPPVGGSKRRLEQVLLNLIVNAVEAMNAGGRLLVAVRQVGELPVVLVVAPRSAGTYVELKVADSGPGIPPEARARIFEPFFTTKNAGATLGTGLGLSTVYAIVEQDGLGLQVQSVAGVGATFLVYLPVEKKPVG